MNWVFASVFLGLVAVSSASAELDESCTVSILNRTTRVRPNGTWVLANVPATVGQIRARATCVEDGITRAGQSDFFVIPANGSVDVPGIVLGEVEPRDPSVFVGYGLPEGLATSDVISPRSDRFFGLPVPSVSPFRE